MKERLAKLNMSLREAHVPSGTERLATAEELAEIGGTPSDPLTETQILALLEIQMKDDLQKAAEESAAQAKAAALHELEAALNPKPADGTVKTAAQPAPVGKVPQSGGGILREREGGAGAFLGGEEERGVQARVEARAVGDVQEKGETQTQAPAPVQPPVQVEELSGLSVKSHA